MSWSHSTGHVVRMPVLQTCDSQFSRTTNSPSRFPLLLKAAALPLPLASMDSLPTTANRMCSLRVARHTRISKSVAAPPLWQVSLRCLPSAEHLALHGQIIRSMCSALIRFGLQSAKQPFPPTPDPYRFPCRLPQ